MRRGVVALFVLLWGVGVAFGQNVTQSVLPSGMTQFSDGNGAPYAGGHVYMYVPSTTTPKTTYQDPYGHTPNQNPISLDANGRAIIWGTGVYRQVLQDLYGNVVWDQLTSVSPIGTSGNTGIIWYGTAIGTANAITLTGVSGFVGTDGQIVGFIANATNTGSATINASGYGSILVQENNPTGSGLAALSGGEIGQGKLYYATYSASANSFVLTDPSQFYNAHGTNTQSVSVNTKLRSSTPLDFVADYGADPTYTNANDAILLQFWSDCQRLSGYYNSSGTFVGGNWCWIPPGHYKFTQNDLLDTSFNQGGGWNIQCAGQNASLLDWSGTPNTGLTIASSVAEGWFYGILENCGFVANSSGPTLRIGGDNLLDASNGFNMTSNWVTNDSATGTALRVNNSADDLLIGNTINAVCSSPDNSGWCDNDTNGDAMELINAGFTSVIGGSYGHAANAFHLTGTGYDFGNTFIAIDCEVVYICIDYDSPNGGANTWLNGQFVFNPSGAAAQDSSTITYAGQVLDNPNVSGFPILRGNYTNFTVKSQRFTGVATPAFTSSPQQFYNTTGRKVLATITGGDITQICIGVYTATCPSGCSCPSFATANIAMSYMLNPGDQLVVTWSSGTPSMYWSPVQ